MRSLLAGFTTRGTSFLAAGLAAALAGLALGERGLVSIGALLFVLPLLSALAAGRARYRLSCVRQLSPARVPAGHTTRVSVRLENVSRLPTGLLLAEDAIPYTLGTRPRYVLDGVERGGIRELTYPLRSDLRGKFTIGPLAVRIADSFGLVALGRSFATTSTLVVTPRVVPLARTAIGASWVGEGDGKTRAAAAAGEDDVVPRAYRDGDELRRVHWRSTARYGVLMGGRAAACHQPPRRRACRCPAARGFHLEHPAHQGADRPGDGRPGRGRRECGGPPARAAGPAGRSARQRPGRNESSGERSPRSRPGHAGRPPPRQPPGSP